ncbi:hypothetical protein I4U23_000671 [Adineta vaga]|nr:hypothetical protein I4U23_000671 [Adineta vaga]
MNVKILAILFLICSTAKCFEFPDLNKTIFIHTNFYSSNGYNLTVKSTPFTLNPAVQHRLSELYFDIYPQLVNRFNRNAPRSIYVFIDGKSERSFWGRAVDSKMIINAYRLRNPRSFSRYYDIFLHELAHLVQQYTTQNLADVIWLGEGLADYVRYTYGNNNLDPNWSMIEYNHTQNYDDSYKVTARFLIWLEHRYNSSIIDKLDQGLREVTYKQNITWKELTGKSVEQLWKDYSQNPNIIRPIPLIKVKVTKDSFLNYNLEMDDKR